MPAASTTSPFSIAAMPEDAPWILWYNKLPVSSLLEEKQTDRRSVFEPDTVPAAPDAIATPPYAPATEIQHNRYNAVLARINQANRKAGGFSDWKT